MGQNWVLNCAYNVAAMLPSDPKEALMVMEIVREMIEKINTPHTRLGRRPGRATTRSGAARKRRPSSMVTNSRVPR